MEKFFIFKNPKALIGTTDKKTKVIFNLDQSSKENNINYVSSWINISKKKILDIKNFTNNNFKITMGKFIKNKKYFVFATLNDNEKMIYRFLLMTSKEEMNKYEKEFKKIVLSFKRISDEELKLYIAPEIKVISATSNSNFLEDILAKSKLQTMFSEEIFRTLNDLKNRKVETNNKIKTIY